MRLFGRKKSEADSKPVIGSVGPLFLVHTTWSKEDEDYLRRWYGYKKIRLIAEHLETTIWAVYSKARRMGLRWPDDE